jgi:TatA/E family protein of Tat protein translocase
VPGIGHWELILLVVVVVLLFGSKQVPQIGRSLGRGMREFKQTVGMMYPREDVRRAMEAPSRPPEAPDDEARVAADDPRRDVP